MKTVGCVLLGAGLSRRMGQAKLLRKVGRRTIFEIALRNHLASSLAAVYPVVAGWLGGFGEILKAFSGDEFSGRLRFVVIDEPCEMSESLKSGWGALHESLAPDGIMISLADQPLVRPATIDLMISAYQDSERPICAPTFEGRRGHPVVINTRLHEDILRLTGDRGARELLQARPDDILEIEVDSDEVILDFDGPEEMDMMISRLGSNERDQQ
jgi:molybdenum cofactor cytidylyltransferase